MNGFKRFYNASMINKLLVINTGIYLLSLIVYLICGSEYFVDWLGTQPTFSRLVFKIWTPITYMFVHVDFMHLLGNMLWLYFMGVIFMTYFNNKQVLGLYLLGGLSGALLYVATYSILSATGGSSLMGPCIGASASVTAIVIAVCVYQPEMEIRIFGVIPMTLKWLGLIYIGYDILQMISGSNTGGHLTHLGGAVAGAMFGMGIRNGKDITVWINKIIDKIVTLWPYGVDSRKSNMHISYKNTGQSTSGDTSARNMSDSDYNKRKADDQKRIDEILDKISKSGYNNLTKEEKEFLFKASKK